MEQKNEHIANLESMNEKLIQELKQNKESNQNKIAEIQEELTKAQNENIKLNDQISNDLQIKIDRLSRDNEQIQTKMLLNKNCNMGEENQCQH